MHVNTVKTGGSFIDGFAGVGLLVLSEDQTWKLQPNLKDLGNTRVKVDDSCNHPNVPNILGIAMVPH